MYEFMGQQRRARRVGMHGFGALPGDEGCPPLASRFGIPGGTCFPIFGGTSASVVSCPPGSSPSMDPLGSGFYVCMPAGAGQPQPVPPPAPSPGVLPGPCPTGTIGVPPYCFTMPAGAPPAPPPAAPPLVKGTCPPGTWGPPGFCVPFQPPPSPPPAPASTPPVAQAAAAAPSPTPAWLVPVAVGVGALALIAIFAAPKMRATPNRRRHR